MLTFDIYISDLKSRHVNITLTENEPSRVPSLREVADNPDTMVHFALPGNAHYLIKQFALTPPGRKFYYSKDSFKPSFFCNYHDKDFYAKEEINHKIIAMQDYFINWLIERDHNRLTHIRAGIREGIGLPQLLTVNLVEFEHFVVSLIVMGALYLLAVVILIIEIIKQDIKEKRKLRKEGNVEEKKVDNESKDTKIAWEGDEAETAKKEKGDMVDCTEEKH